MEIDSGAAASSSATTAAAGFAAANKLDMPLDQLISANRQARRRQRRPTGGRQPGGQQQQQQQQKPYQRRPVAANAKKSGVVAKALTPAPDVGSKIIVSNLHFGVTESDLRVRFPLLLLLLVPQSTVTITCTTTTTTAATVLDYPIHLFDYYMHSLYYIPNSLCGLCGLTGFI